MSVPGYTTDERKGNVRLAAREFVPQLQLDSILVTKLDYLVVYWISWYTSISAFSNTQNGDLPFVTKAFEDRKVLLLN